jgi:hypothetical protein
MDTIVVRRWVRWWGTFIGFPLAGVAARAAVGDIDTAGAAAIGGLVAGTVLGAVQVAIGGIGAGERVAWVAASAAGFTAGLTVGAVAVDFRTDASSLAVVGLASGAGVGLAQALSVPMRPRDRVAWALATPLLWAGAWLITSQVIVDADRHHAVFGSSGAAAASALAGVLFARREPRSRAERGAGSPVASGRTGA